MVPPAIRKTLGWGLAIISAIGLTLGLTFVGLAIALQFMDPHGFQNNLLGFAVIVGACPLPLTTLSFVCLLIGLGLVYFAHQEESGAAASTTKNP